MRRAVEKCSPARPNKLPTEHKEQSDFVKWFRLKFPDIKIFAIPNGGSRHILEAVNLKRQGVLPGVADLYVPKWRLWIEFKRAKGGKLTDDQVEFREYVTQVCGDNWMLAEGFKKAEELLLQQMRDHPNWRCTGDKKK